MNSLKQYYTIIYAQAFSPCGKYLAGGNNQGKVQIFNLTPFLFSDDDACILEDSHCNPIFTFPAHMDPIYAMASTDTFLILGTVGEVSGWRWRDILKKDASPVWVWAVPQSDVNFLVKSEVNSLAVGLNESQLVVFAGCGNNKIHCWDLESGNLMYSFSGHTDYIHCVMCTANECVSSSEDGTVRFWDTRKRGEAVHQITPFKEDSLNRPRYGKWIGCVAVDQNEDWLVCGGGPKLCLWHLRSLSAAVPFECDSTTSVALFHDDMIISGGSTAFVNQWSFSGELKVQVPTSASHVYSIAVSTKKQPKVMSIGGSSHKLDICTNFKYKDFSLIGL